jgi:hypothetical protein
LSERQKNEAYMLANPGITYGILMTGSYGDGVVLLDTRECRGRYALTWINIQTGRPLKAKTIDAEDEIHIKMPREGGKYGWLAAIVRK